MSELLVDFAVTILREKSLEFRGQNGFPLSVYSCLIVYSILFSCVTGVKDKVGEEEEEEGEEEEEEEEGEGEEEEEKEEEEEETVGITIDRDRNIIIK